MEFVERREVHILTVLLLAAFDRLAWGHQLVAEVEDRMKDALVDCTRFHPDAMAQKDYSGSSPGIVYQDLYFDQEAGDSL